MSADRIRIVIQEKTAEHPELRRPLTWNAFRRILAREDVGLFVTPLPRPAQLVPYLGAWSILINAAEPARRHTYYGAHELGHLWLHHDRHFDRSETRVYNMGEGWESDPLEDEAEYFAACVLSGPRFVRQSRELGEIGLQTELPLVREEPWDSSD